MHIFYESQISETCSRVCVEKALIDLSVSLQRLRALLKILAGVPRDCDARHTCEAGSACGGPHAERNRKLFVMDRLYGFLANLWACGGLCDSVITDVSVPVYRGDRREVRGNVDPFQKPQGGEERYVQTPVADRC